MCCAIPHVDRTIFAIQLAQIRIGMRRMPNVRSSRRSQHATSFAAGIMLATTIAHMENGIMDFTRVVTGTMDRMSIASGTIMNMASSTKDLTPWCKGRM